MADFLGLDDGARQACVKSLHELLNRESSLYHRTLEAHWNVEGASFGPLHELFQEQYEALQGWVDEVAERIRILGVAVKGPVKTDLCCTEDRSCGCSGENAHSWKGYVEALLKDHHDAIVFIRDAIAALDGARDYGTEDMLTDLLRWHEKSYWFLKSHLG
jgi:starvation-inducible DNA-binding protein